jgi:hypothetical protein
MGLILWLILMLPQVVEAATRYVDPACTNGISIYNPTASAGSRCTGGSSQSYTTIANGMSPTVAGDTLFVRAGTYTTLIPLVGKNGTSGNYITIKAYPGETVTIRTSGDPWSNVAFSWIIIDGFDFDGINAGQGAGPNINDDATGNPHDVILQNNTVRNFAGVTSIVGDRITVRNNTFRNFRCTTCLPGDRIMAIYAHHGTDVVIEGNTIIDNVGGGMQIQPGPWSGVIVRNNIVARNDILDNVGGILVSGGAGPITGVQIYNNLVYRNGVGGLPSYGINVGNNTQGAKIWNNTVYGTNGYGIIMQIGSSAPTNTVVQNNIAYQNSDGDIFNDGITSTVNTNLCGTAGSGKTFCGLIGNPLFVNAAADDYHIQTGSPAINVGVNLSASFTTDFAGTTRTVPWDIGAYKAAGDVTAPLPPTGLTVE